ncbi:MAG: tryptophan-rich sensory protein [Gemmatimonadetes bacterium]|nr:tryptophan-rich sensory protein [Gemmatimonadota bacterium]
MMTTRRITVMKVVNLATFVAVIALNGAAASGAMSGDSIGVIANRYRSLFLPANWVFGIWSLIYLGLTASVVYQVLPSRGSARAVDRLGPWWVVASVLNVAWITLFSFAQFGLALVVMVVFLVSLIVTGERLRRGAGEGTEPGSADSRSGDPAGRAELMLVRWPFDLYLAWISVAVIANTFQYMHVIQWGGFGIAEQSWSLAMLVVATLLGAVMAWGRGMWVFPLVVAWAVYGIGARYAELPAIATMTEWLVPLGIAGGSIAWWMGRRRTRPSERAR